MAENQGLIDNVLAWLHEGYPEGVPPKDYFPLLALLKRSLTEDEVIRAAQSILRSTDADTVTEVEIRKAIARRHRQGAQSRGDPPGRVAAGVGGLAARVIRALTAAVSAVSLWRRAGADGSRAPARRSG